MSTVSEWVACLSILVYISTLANELGRIHLKVNCEPVTIDNRCRYTGLTEAGESDSELMTRKRNLSPTSP